MNLGPKITINGFRMNEGATMTILVALNHFSEWLNHNDLGNDELGKNIHAGYVNQIHQINRVIWDTDNILK